MDQVYKLDNIFRVYQKEFEVVPCEDYWPSYEGYNVCHDPEMRRHPHGRPKSSRIRNEMDMREIGKLNGVDFVGVKVIVVELVHIVVVVPKRLIMKNKMYLDFHISHFQINPRHLYYVFHIIDFD